MKKKLFGQQHLREDLQNQVDDLQQDNKELIEQVAVYKSESAMVDDRSIDDFVAKFK